MASATRRRFLAGAGTAVASGIIPGSAAAHDSHQPAEGGRTQAAADPRDLSAKDQRLNVRDLNTARIPARFASRAQWEARAARLREQILSATGLWPTPKRGPLNAQIFDRIEMEDGCSIEKVYFESYPKFFCTGNLYRPRGGTHQPPFPGILCPHGHWSYGRMENCPGDDNGTSVPMRCMNFARQGLRELRVRYGGIQ